MVMDGKDGKSYLADGHFAQLEGIKEESTLLLRNFYKSKQFFLDDFSINVSSFWKTAKWHF